ncbi:DUF2336 domain-containing protein [Kiloniella laminariae]|uniref:DUF2336 domain-containing protein n=1 Tax=Kiloniella laminariae TaxID=454162 RepID=A0ABT4LEH6_9PROT|nr:DUF2336 domain-containing protein [Kiloniella laminariae]MCZ4279501.1 DUF2336 domain-containing protein [Kiloniella laminariae]
MSLTQQDVAKLLADPSPVVRAQTTAKIASHFDSKEFTAEEKAIAEDIFRALVKDAEVVVREALANTLKASEDLPRDVALAMARDVESVSLPVLKYSEVFSDEDLIAILNSEGAAKQEAIALRSIVSEAVSDAVIDTGNESAVAKLVSNEGAAITEKSYGRVMTEYKESEMVSGSLSRRPSLPPSIAQRLMSSLSDRLQEYVVSRKDLDFDQASNLILQVRERATVSLLKNGSSHAELVKLVKQLNKSGKLTPSLVLRALCTGDMMFFECAMSEMAGIPLKNAQALIHDEGALGLKSLYTKAGMLMAYFPFVKAAIRVHREMDYSGEQNDREVFASRLLERLLTVFELPDQELSPNEVEYLVTKLQQYSA